LDEALECSERFIGAPKSIVGSARNLLEVIQDLTSRGWIEAPVFYVH